MRLREAARRATAYHEAGHAVAAWSLGAEIRKASIVPEDGSYGSVEHTSTLRGLDFDGCERHAAVAGSVSVRLTPGCAPGAGR